MLRVARRQKAEFHGGGCLFAALIAGRLAVRYQAMSNLEFNFRYEVFRSDTDFNAILTRLKGQQFDVLYVPGYYQEASLLIKAARGLGINQPILGGDGYDSPVLLQQALTNLVVNALHACVEGGRVTLLAGEARAPRPGTDGVHARVSWAKSRRGLARGGLQLAAEGAEVAEDLLDLRYGVESTFERGTRSPRCGLGRGLGKQGGLGCGERIARSLPRRTRRHERGGEPTERGRARPELLHDEPAEHAQRPDRLAPHEDRQQHGDDCACMCGDRGGHGEEDTSGR